MSANATTDRTCCNKESIVGHLQNAKESFENFFNKKYVVMCLGKLNYADTNKMRLTRNENTALKVIKVLATVLTLGLGPALYFAVMKGCMALKETILRCCRKSSEGDNGSPINPNRGNPNTTIKTESEDSDSEAEIDDGRQFGVQIEWQEGPTPILRRNHHRSSPPHSAAEIQDPLQSLPDRFLRMGVGTSDISSSPAPKPTSTNVTQTLANIQNTLQNIENRFPAAPGALTNSATTTTTSSTNSGTIAAPLAPLDTTSTVSTSAPSPALPLDPTPANSFAPVTPTAISDKTLIQNYWGKQFQVSPQYWERVSYYGETLPHTSPSVPENSLTSTLPPVEVTSTSIGSDSEIPMTPLELDANTSNASLEFQTEFKQVDQEFQANRPEKSEGEFVNVDLSMSSTVKAHKKEGASLFNSDKILIQNYWGGQFHISPPVPENLLTPTLPPVKLTSSSFSSDSEIPMTPLELDANTSNAGTEFKQVDQEFQANRPEKSEGEFVNVNLSMSSTVQAPEKEGASSFNSEVNFNSETNLIYKQTKDLFLQNANADLSMSSTVQGPEKEGASLFNSQINFNTETNLIYKQTKDLFLQNADENSTSSSSSTTERESVDIKPYSTLTPSSLDVISAIQAYETELGNLKALETEGENLSISQSLNEDRSSSSTTTTTTTITTSSSNTSETSSEPVKKVSFVLPEPTTVTSRTNLEAPEKTLSLRTSDDSAWNAFTFGLDTGVVEAPVIGEKTSVIHPTLNEGENQTIAGQLFSSAVSLVTGSSGQVIETITTLVTDVQEKLSSAPLPLDSSEGVLSEKNSSSDSSSLNSSLSFHSTLEGSSVRPEEQTNAPTDHSLLEDLELLKEVGEKLQNLEKSLPSSTPEVTEEEVQAAFQAIAVEETKRSREEFASTGRGPSTMVLPTVMSKDGRQFVLVPFGESSTQDNTRSDHAGVTSASAQQLGTNDLNQEEK